MLDLEIYLNLNYTCLQNLEMTLTIIQKIKMEKQKNETVVW